MFGASVLEFLISGSIESSNNFELRVLEVGRHAGGAVGLRDLQGPGTLNPKS